MEKSCIGLIAAMPEEIRPLLRRIGPVTREKLGAFKSYRFSGNTREIRLIESGMGPEKSAAATRTLIAAVHPELVVNFGFCGAVTPGLAVGDIVVAERILLNRDRLFSEQPGLATAKSDEIAEFLAGILREETFRVSRGTFITAAQIKSKREMAALLPAGTTNPVLEMESAAVALVAAREKVPITALRAVSDGAEEELGFSIEEFADREMNIRLGKVILTVARKPWIMPQLLRLAKNSRRAGESLALAVTSVLEQL